MKLLSSEIKNKSVTLVSLDSCLHHLNAMTHDK